MGLSNLIKTISGQLPRLVHHFILSMPAGPWNPRRPGDRWQEDDEWNWQKWNKFPISFMNRVKWHWQALTDDEEGIGVVVKVDYHKADVVVRDGRTMVSKQCNSWRLEAQLRRGAEMVAKMYLGMGTQATHRLSHPWVIFGKGLSVALACVKVLHDDGIDLQEDTTFTGDITRQVIEDAWSAAKDASRRKRQRASDNDECRG